MSAPPDPNDRGRLLQSMRRTLQLMRMMGCEPEALADVLEIAAKELRGEIEQRKKGSH
jgi:hypothetical protein